MADFLEKINRIQGIETRKVWMTFAGVPASVRVSRRDGA